MARVDTKERGKTFEIKMNTIRISEYKDAEIGFESLMNLFVEQSEQLYNGHFTLLSFTSGFKAAFGTVDLDSGIGRKYVHLLPTFRSITDAVTYAINYDINFHEIAEACDKAGDSCKICLVEMNDLIIEKGGEIYHENCIDKHRVPCAGKKSYLRKGKVWIYNRI